MTLSARGILNPHAAQRRFALTRHDPSPDLAELVERYWLIRWDLREPYVQETLPYPCVNLVFENGVGQVHGPMTRRFTKQLRGQGNVVGIKFRPGGFYPFLRAPVATLTDRSRPFEALFTEPTLAAELWAIPEREAQVARVEVFLRRQLPDSRFIDPQVNVAAEIVAQAEQTPNLLRAEDLADHVGLSLRALQRLFRTYVGVTPKAVIRRFRIQEAAERASQGPVDWATTALELGYCDQAHFIRDFKAQVGRPPAQYAAQCAGCAGSGGRGI